MTRTPPKADAPLGRYRQKRNFRVTPEPAGHAAEASAGESLRFVIQKHWARRLHYDFRLELDGVMMSWAVPKGPSYDPAEKRMAVHVEDHPVSYADFEGEIPPKQYGAGSVIIWDRGTWTPKADPRAGLAAGKLIFTLHGEKLAGLWELVRISKPGDRADQWFLFKKRDRWARPHADFDVVAAFPDSVITHPLGPLDDAPATTDAALPSVEDAPRAPLPPRLAPQLATLSPTVPSGEGWIIETKFDGYRLLARIDDAAVTLFTRNGHDWTSRFGTLAKELEKLDLSEGWIDGEIVVLTDGMPDFNALQNAIDRRGADDMLLFFAFDLPFWEGRDLRALPLSARRAHLAGLVEGRSERVRFSEAFEATAADMFVAACQLGLEGLMFKRADAPYVSGRTEHWLKAKCRQRQEFVIGGYAERAGAPAEIGKLILGYYEGRELHHAGGVGTGWDSETAAALRKKLDKLRIAEPAFHETPKASGRWSRSRAPATHWVKPTLVAEVEFAEWTPDAQIRHAVFRGLRSDKPASTIRRESARAVVAPHGKVSIKVTNPERVIDATTGITKVDLVRYYESIADAMLPHLAARPVSVVRAPGGIGDTMFFQKHADTARLGLTEQDAALWPGHAAILTADSTHAIVTAAQMNAIEFHTWNSTVRRIDKPDRVIFDLDPGEGVPWEHVQEAALLVQSLLDGLGLKAWLKTSGGKGLHVVVPVAPRREFDPVKDFSQRFVRHLAATLPQRFVAVSGPANRKGRIFVDYLRNGFGQTTAAAFSARARPGLGVSMPIGWEQLSTLKSGAQWTIRDAREYLSFQVTDPWQEYWTSKQTLTEALKLLG